MNSERKAIAQAIAAQQARRIANENRLHALQRGNTVREPRETRSESDANRYLVAFAEVDRAP